jgi:predicted transcriptional regulator
MATRRTTRQNILALIERRPRRGITRKEIQTRTGYLIQTVTPRVNELLNEGLVVEGDKRINGSTIIYPVV